MSPLDRAGEAAHAALPPLPSRNPSTPYGIEWRRLHETWMQAENA